MSATTVLREIRLANGVTWLLTRHTYAGAPLVATRVHSWGAELSVDIDDQGGLDVTADHDTQGVYIPTEVLRELIDDARQRKVIP